MARLWLLVAVAVLAAIVVEVHSSCQRPLTPEEGFSCTNADANFFRNNLPPSLWWTATTPPEKFVPGIDYIKNYYQCCRHCVWSTEYPITSPIVAMTSSDLDCVKFKQEFTIFDGNADNKLNSSELNAYLGTGPNLYLQENHLLNPSNVFSLVDLNRDGDISLEEYLALRHYWAVVHLGRTGPTSSTVTGSSLKDGPLGGFYLDYGQIKIWFTLLNGLLLERYLDMGWDESLIRVPTDEELLDTVRLQDLDGSTRISFEEHYFRVFADRNSDGVVSKDEYYLSLYRRVNDAGERDNPYLYPINFNLHDWNGDSEITFLERKFVAADIDQNAQLDEDEWVKGDFPLDYGPFEGHSVTSEIGQPTVNTLRYFYYTIFHECAAQGTKEYRTTLATFPWSRTCLVKILIEPFEPFVMAEYNTTKECGDALFCNSTATSERLDHGCDTDNDCVQGRACSYFGFCQLHDDLEPNGPYQRKPRWNVQPSGYSVDVLKEAMARLRYNYTITVKEKLTIDEATAPTPKSGSKQLWPPATTLVLSSAFGQMRYDALQAPITTSKYACSQSLWDSDGFVLVTRTEPDILSNQLAMWYMLGSPSFINFLALFFFFVLIMGHIFWFFEKNENPLFRLFYAEGVMDGLWFAVVTVTTVGYGDKVPITGLGRLVCAFWMLFGLICFGLFGGQVISQISEMQVANNIVDISSVNGISVGVLNTTFYNQLSTMYGFSPDVCETIDECGDKVQNRAVKAMLVPHSDVVNYFNRAGLASAKCGNPLKIVGEPLLTGDPRFGVHNSVCACDTCDKPVVGTSIYASQYLTNAINSALQGMSSEGWQETAEENHLSAVVQLEECDDPIQFDIPMIIACAITITIYAAFSWFCEHPKTKPIADKIYTYFANRLSETAYSLGIRHRKSTYLRDDEMEEIIERAESVLAETSRNQEISKYISKLQTLCLHHNADVRKLQSEVMEGRRTMSKVIQFFTTAGALVLCVVCIVSTALVIVWGTEIRPSALGIPEGAVITTGSTQTL